MDKLLEILGALGAYFAVMLVLAVAVETLVDPLTVWFGIFQKKVSPEELAKDLEQWLPENEARQKAGAATIAKFIKDYNATRAEVTADAKQIQAVAQETAKAFGLNLPKAESKVQTEFAVRLFQIRERYKIDERRRIALLRLVSVIVGITIAWLLNINTFELVNLPLNLDPKLVSVGGVALSGLAASAGSSFWHDQLGKVRAVKEATIRG